MSKGRKNRRHVDRADVRAAARAALAPLARILSGLLAAAILIVLGVYGFSAARRFLTTSPCFAIERITFTGTQRAAEGELLKLGGLSLGDNLFEVDIAEAERGMGAHPWVQKVVIERVYPRSLAVQVLEHEPAALAELGGLYHVDKNGRAFKKLAPGEDADLPILTGVSREQYVARPDQLESLFREAIESAAVYAESGLAKSWPLSEIHADESLGLTLFCGRPPVAVRLGTGAIAEKLRKLEVLFTELLRRGARAEVIRLDNRARPGWVAVQLAQGQAPEVAQ